MASQMQLQSSLSDALKLLDDEDLDLDDGVGE